MNQWYLTINIFCPSNIYVTGDLAFLVIFFGEDYSSPNFLNIEVNLADKSEDHFEKSHQDDKRSERIYCGLKKFQ